jgi:hypothetical protein
MMKLDTIKRLFLLGPVITQGFCEQRVARLRIG